MADKELVTKLLSVKHLIIMLRSLMEGCYDVDPYEREGIEAMCRSCGGFGNSPNHVIHVGSCEVQRAKELLHDLEKGHAEKQKLVYVTEV